MYGTGDHHIKQNKPGSERQICDDFSHMWNLKKLRTRKQKRDYQGTGTGPVGGKKRAMSR
jgi:hypothetical protein